MKGEAILTSPKCAYVVVSVASLLTAGAVRAQSPTVSLARSLTSHTKNVHAAPFSRDGRYLVSASSDQTVKLWEVKAGREVQTFTGHTGDVNAAAISPDERLLASGGD
jgi:WD40 repeat protein